MFRFLLKLPSRIPEVYAQGLPVFPAHEGLICIKVLCLLATTLFINGLESIRKPILRTWPIEFFIHRGGPLRNSMGKLQKQLFNSEKCLEKNLLT